MPVWRRSALLISCDWVWLESARRTRMRSRPSGRFTFCPAGDSCRSGVDGERMRQLQDLVSIFLPAETDQICSHLSFLAATSSFPEKSNFEQTSVISTTYPTVLGKALSSWHVGC